MPAFHGYYLLLRDWALIAAVLAGPMLGLGWIVRRRGSLVAAQRSRAVPWGGAQVIAAFLAYQIVTMIFVDLFRQSGILLRVYGSSHWKAELEWIRYALWAVTAALPFHVATIVFVMWSWSETRPYQLGLTTHRLAGNVLLGFLYWLVLMPVILLFYVVVARIYEVVFNFQPEPHSIQQLVKDNPLWADWVLAIFTSLVAAPVLEELLYRGILQNWAERRAARADIVMGLCLVVAIGMRLPGLLKVFRESPHAPLPSWSGLVWELQATFFVAAMLPIYLAMRWKGTPPRPAASPAPSKKATMPSETIQPGSAVVGIVAATQGRPVPHEKSAPLPGSGQDDEPLRRWRIAATIFSCALLFAVWHAGVWPSPIPLLTLGLLLGYLTYRTRSLVAPIVVHVLFNAVAILNLLRQ